MAAVAKDLALGSVIMIACIGLLAVAFSTPSNTPNSGGDPILVSNGFDDRAVNGPGIPPVEPTTPSFPNDQDEPEVFTPDEVFDDSAQFPPVTDNGVEENQSDNPFVLTTDDLETPVVEAPIQGGDQPNWERPVTEAEGPEEEIATPVVVDSSPVIEAPAPVVQRGPRKHTVVSGETLQSISSQYYGTTRKWRLIQDTNDANQYDLMPGMVLTIPALDEPTDVAAISPVSPTPTGSGPRTYTIKSGDSYYTIARDQLGNAQRYKELEKLNGIDPFDLKVGTKIKLPGSVTAVAAQPSLPSAAPAVPSGSKVHVVERGEILGDISMKYYGTSRRWRVIADANGISDATSLREGQRLIIPDAATRTVRVPSGTAASSSSAPVENRGDGVWHEVKSGDTFQVISKRYYGTTTRHGEITKANPSLDSTRLQIGTKVWVPQATSSTESTASRSEERPSPFEVVPVPVPVTEDSSTGPDWGSISP